MKQFQVPQFITIEDKVVGPFTIKQFLYIAGGAIIIGIAYKFLQSFLFLPIAVVVGAAAAALAFVKINETPFPIIVKNAFLYFTRPHLYLWKQEKTKKPPAEAGIRKPDAAPKTIPKMSESKLSDLAWSLDIEEKMRQ